MKIYPFVGTVDFNAGNIADTVSLCRLFRFSICSGTIVIRDRHYGDITLAALSDQLLRRKFTIITVPAVHMQINHGIASLVLANYLDS